jgi:hypothetical protein
MVAVALPLIFDNVLGQHDTSSGMTRPNFSRGPGTADDA